MSACRRCGHEVTWLHTSRGKLAPFQVDLDGPWCAEHGDAVAVGMFTPDTHRLASHPQDCAPRNAHKSTERHLYGT